MTYVLPIGVVRGVHMTIADKGDTALLLMGNICRDRKIPYNRFE